MSDVPDELLRARVAALEYALGLMVETFVVHDFEQAWRWDEEDGEPDLVEPFANAVLNARFVLDTGDWLAHEIRNRGQ